MAEMQFNVIGLMSGSSVDGLDVAYCTFNCDGDGVQYVINYARTFDYSSKMKARLRTAEKLSALDFVRLDRDLGMMWGHWIKEFINENKITNIDFISSHGHTIFHQPADGITTQIGNTAHIKAITQLAVISDFRSLDVALGGNGAPLVPIGDQILFNQYIACVNIGGFANISYNHSNTRIAYDITPANIILNHYAQQLGYDYDHNGDESRKGVLNELLFSQLSMISYYALNAPKSLGKEDVVRQFIPLIDCCGLSVNDKLRTVLEVIAVQIAASINQIQCQGEVLFTGGGCYNSFLMERIKHYSPSEMIIPSSLLVNYKEALIFALLGVLRITNKTNCLNSVTGAEQDNCGGTIL